MLEFKTTIDKGTKICNLNLPTSMKEVTNDYLLDVTQELKVADHYSLIALISRESPAGLVLSLSKKTKATSIWMVPVFVKAGNTDSEFIKSIATGNKLVISASDIAIGDHINAPKNLISSSKVMRYLTENKADHTRALGLSEDCYYVDFKIVPNSAIHSFVTLESDYKNPFVTIKDIPNDSKG